MTSRKQWVVAGVDDGFDETKIVLGDGTSFRMPSRARAGELNRIDISGTAQKTVFLYQTRDGKYTVGRDIDRADSTASDDYPLSAMNRAVVTHALREAGVEAGAELFLCSGLPVKKFYRKGTLNTPFIKQKKQNLLENDVVAEDGTALARIARHEVVSEGIAAWMDFVMQRNASGKLEVNEELVAQRIGIVDIGGRTTDIAVIRDWQLDTERSSTVEVGMIAVREALREAISEEYDVEVNDQELARALTDGRIRMWGKDQDVSAIAAGAIKVAVNRIRSETMRRLGRAADLEQVIFVGGTVVAIQRHLEGWFPNQVIGTDPSFANARGMAKYAEFILAAQGA
ncbi:plasmid segregation protein ParM [Natronocella acetinitrilica]|uniref:Plasmid segregation protein ParM n=1 Tax=Natronocella acetinitrilica TaxID=414046 RepID=A0AAE3KAE1_9GAMM|nr:ParM/StbA family protein [Natronocella acetinitrilica]MCP1674165.1 plasmid segregation protein ParM [Natronocella acetinitrilica]